MPLEIEIKMKVDDLDAIERRVIDAGGEFVADMLEKNTYFDSRDRAFTGADQGLRIRQEFGASDGSLRQTVMTYKGPREPGLTKKREEIEFALDHAEAATEILERLGFGISLAFEKSRKRYRLADCIIELDILEALGRFVEIEGPSDESVLAMRDRLGLADFEVVSKGYAALVAQSNL